MSEFACTDVRVPLHTATNVQVTVQPSSDIAKRATVGYDNSVRIGYRPNRRFMHTTSNTALPNSCASHHKHPGRCARDFGNRHD